MKFRHRFRVRAPLERVAAFHRRADSMAAITPPPVGVRIHRAPPILSEGDEMAFTLRIGLLPVHWVASIESLSENGFVDRQLTGPFKSWLHRHRFYPAPGGHIEVLDDVEAHLRPHLLWGPLGLLMWLGLPVLFAYRGWKTRRLLEKEA